MLKLVHYDDIVHLLPEDCAYVHYTENTGKLIVIYSDGNLSENFLNLDSPCFSQAIEFDEDDFDEDAYITFILVEGNLRARNIYCQNVSTAVGLVVLGDVSVKNNVAVGGQQLYVGGKLSVAGLYWGDYTEGSLVVNGSVEVRVFMATQGYNYDRERFLTDPNMQVQYLLDDELNAPEVIASGEVLWALFKEKYLSTREEILAEGENLYSYAAWINMEMLFEVAIPGGRFVLKQAEQVDEELLKSKLQRVSKEERKISNEQEATLIFENTEVSVANLRKLCRLNTLRYLGKYDREEEALRFEFREGETFKRMMAYVGDYDRVYVYLQHSDAFGYLAGLQLTDEGDYEVVVGYRQLSDTMAFEKIAESDSRYTWFREQWALLIEEYPAVVAAQRAFKEIVTYERFVELMNLKDVRKHFSDYYDERSVFRINNYAVQFRPKSRGQEARITLTEEVAGEFCFYHISFGDDKRPVLKTQDGNDYHLEVYEVPLCEARMYHKAAVLFERFYTVLMRSEV